MRARIRSSSGRPTQEQLEERKTRVLEVARALFIERGFAGTTMAEVAKRALVSPRFITSHFGDKADILSGIFHDSNDRAVRFAHDIQHEGTLEEVLFGAAQFAWITAYSPEAIGLMRMVVGEGGNLSDRTADIAEQASNHFFASMEGIFTRLIERGLIPDANVQSLAKYFVDLVIGFSLVQAGMGYWNRVPDDDELRDKVDFFCRGMTRLV